MTGSITAGSFERLRIEQQKSNAQAAKLFVEETLGQPLASDDLHQELKDGVVLCSLLNKIQAGTVLQINRKDQAFVKMANISSFLQGASKLGLQNSELFQTVDLWEAKDMMAVVHTLLSLARLSSKRTDTKSKPAKHMPSSTKCSQQLKSSQSNAQHKADFHPFSNTKNHDGDEKQSRWPLRHKRERSTTAVVVDAASVDRKTLLRKEDGTKNYLNVRNIFSHAKSAENKESLPLDIDTESNLDSRRLSISSSTSPIIQPKRSSSDLSADDSLGSIVRWHSKRRSQADSAYGSLNFLMDEKSSHDDATSEIQGMQQTLLEIRDVLNDRPSPVTRAHPSPPPPLCMMPSKSTPTQRTSEIEAETKVFHRPDAEKRPAKIMQETCDSPKINQKQQRERVALRDEEGNAIAQFQLGNCIGKGQFGVVYRALDVDTGHLYAVKRIKVELQDEVDQEMMQEVELLKSMDHPNVVKYIGCTRTEKHLDVILEFVESGSLLSTLKSFGTFSENLVAAYTVKILLGLSYLHAKEVVHCDLKAANILTTKTGSVKLTDFGVSLNLKLKQVDNGEPVGTPNWMAPEIIELQGASVKSDIWSLGCTIVELYTGKPPYSDLISMSALYRIVEDDMPPLPSDISSSMRDFLVCCFQKDPQHRPSSMELLRHEWLATAFAAEGDVSRLWATDNELSVNNLTSFTSLNRSDNCLSVKPEVNGDSTRHRLTRFNTRRGSLPARKADQVHIVHHSFLKTTFEKAITCKVCEDNIKKHAMFCEACAIVCHDKCRPLAPHCVNATRFSDKERHYLEISGCRQSLPIPNCIPTYIPTSRQARSPYLSNNAAVNSPNVTVLSSYKRPINLRRKSKPEGDNCIIS